MTIKVGDRVTHKEDPYHGVVTKVHGNGTVAVTHKGATTTLPVGDVVVDKIATKGVPSQKKQRKQRKQK